MWEPNIYSNIGVVIGPKVDRLWHSPMDWQYSLASCCSKSLHPNFQVTTNPFPFQKWLGAWAAHLAVPPTILETSQHDNTDQCLILW